MPKRRSPEGDEVPDSLDFRHQKLKLDSSGQLLSEQGAKNEKKEAATLGQFATANDKISHKVFREDGTVDEDLLGSSAGHGYRHAARFIKKHPEMLDMISSDTTSEEGGDDDDQAADVSLLTPAADLTDDAIEDVLTNGFVKGLQDPNEDVQHDPGPIVQVLAVKHVDPLHAYGHTASVRPIQFTLADGDHYVIPARVSVRMTDKAEGVGNGYVIQIKQAHRFDADLYNDDQSQPTLGIIDFDILGRGNVIGNPQVCRSRPVEEVAAAAKSNTASTHDLDGWNFEENEPPPVPDPCTAPGRSCSMAGVNFYRRCVCEEHPVGDQDLEDIKKVYYAATEEVADMTMAHKRNMLYWLYATDVYGWRGWQNRLELPPCLVFAIRKLYPNPKGIPYVEFKTADE